MLGMNLAVAGEVGPAMGWFGRAERLVEQAEPKRAESGDTPSRLRL